MPKRSIPVVLSVADQSQLRQWERAHGTPQQVGLRCRIVLGAAEGEDSLHLAARLHVNRHTANLWRRRVNEEGVGAVWEVAPGRGRKPRYGVAKRDGIIEATLRSKPEGKRHWSCRTMAKAQGVSKNTVNRLWQLHNLKPHLQPAPSSSRGTRSSWRN